MGGFEILLPTDVFPPKAGGSGWSTHALALALRERGHGVTVLVPARNAPSKRRSYDGLPVIEVGYRAPRLPFVANYARFERFWPRFAAAIVAAAPAKRPLLIHGQHVQSIGAAVLAGERLAVPVVATVRDHWPRHYFDTGLHGNALPYADFASAAAATDLVARRGPLAGALSLAALPYVLGHVRRRQALLARCDAVISLSAYITGRLEGLVAAERLHPIPNMVDLAAIDAICETPPETVIEGPYVLYVGKLARNKGAHLLPAIMASMRAAGGEATLVVAGDGDSRVLDAVAAAGIAVRRLDWAPHDEVLRLMRHAAALVFPSVWGEPLSRVLLEACAVGAAIVAMPTGGTPDLLAHDVSARFAVTPEGLGRELAAVLGDAGLAGHLRASARATAVARLAAPVVIAQIEALYGALLERRPLA